MQANAAVGMLDAATVCKDMQQGCLGFGGTSNPDFCKEGGIGCKIVVSGMQCGDDAGCNDPTKGKKPCCASMATYQKATVNAMCSGVNAKLMDEAVCCPRLRCCTGGLSGGPYNYQRVPRLVVPALLISSCGSRIAVLTSDLFMCRWLR